MRYRVGIDIGGTFSDLVVIAADGRVDDRCWEEPAPLVTRRLRYEVTERMAAAGGVVTPLDVDDAARVVDAVLAERIEAVAVVLVHAYANADHERRIGQLVAQRAP